MISLSNRSWILTAGFLGCVACGGGDGGNGNGGGGEVVRLAVGMYDDATELYRSALTGHFADDPNLLLGFAKVQLDKGDPAEAQRAPDQLREQNPTFQSADGHLLYARTLEGQGKQDEAMHEYEAVAGYYPGFEAKVRYALYLLKLGQAQRGREMLEAVAKAYKQLPRHAQELNRDWYLVAKKNLEG